METNGERPRLPYRRGRFGPRASRLLARILAVAVGVVVLIGAIAVSIVLFAVTLTGLVVFGIYLWWKTRDLRKQIRSQSRDANVIEGEVIRKTGNEETKKP